ncbi:MAG: serine/threonine protein kinase [Polyangiaceae bacterium]|nr:serine/threonine protein kinase [Polyangiaceae bacterium]
MSDAKEKLPSDETPGPDTSIAHDPTLYSVRAEELARAGAGARASVSTTHARLRSPAEAADPAEALTGEPPPTSLPPPARLAEAYLGCTVDGRYHIESLLGEGGMGLVFRARRKVIDKPVAVKVLRADLAQDREVTERFLTEARAASSIGNAHIIDVIDVGELPDGSTYFVMELLEGAPLSRVIADEHPLPAARVLGIARQIADALAAAHGAGIVHRDLKPDNVYVLDRDGADFVKVLDFGVAKVAGLENRITRAGTIFGTPHYMSPEQAKGLAVDARADVYALGVILFELCAGAVPFDAENPLAVLTQHMTVPPPRLGERGVVPGRVPLGLEAVIEKCLAKEPEDRYASMVELIADLSELEAGSEPRALLESRARRVVASAPPPRSPPTRGVLAFGVLGVAAGGALTWWLATAPPTGGDAGAPVAESASVPPPVGSAPPALRGSDARAVALVLSPIDAEVFQGDTNLGMMPVTVRVRAGESSTLEVRREGFHSRRVSVDGSQPRVLVRLVPMPGKRPAIPVPADPPDLFPAEDPPAGSATLPPAESAAPPAASVDGPPAASAPPPPSAGPPPSPATSAPPAPPTTPPAPPAGSGA